MEGERTEIARAKATAVVSNRKSNLFNRRNTSVFDIRWVEGSHVGKGVNLVKLLSFKRRHWRILNEHFVVVILDYRLSVDTILIFILNTEGIGIFFLICFKFVVVKSRGNGEMHRVIVIGKITSAANIVNFLYGHALIQQKCNSAKDIFTHSVCKNVCARVNEN